MKKKFEAAIELRRKAERVMEGVQRLWPNSVHLDEDSVAKWLEVTNVVCGQDTNHILLLCTSANDETEPV